MYMYKLTLQAVSLRCILLSKETFKLETVKCEWKYKHFDIFQQISKDTLASEHTLLLSPSLTRRGGRVLQAQVLGAGSPSPHLRGQLHGWVIQGFSLSTVSVPAGGHGSGDWCVSGCLMMEGGLEWLDVLECHRVSLLLDLLDGPVTDR